MHTSLKDPVRVLKAKPACDVSWPRALGGATPPEALSIARFVTPDQFANPALKSSAKIADADDDTVMGAEATLI